MSADAERRDAEAKELVRQWRQRATVLEEERLRDLRRLTEADAAQRFARMLSLPPHAYPLRPGSGLVEQQKIFSRLRERRG